MNPGWLERQRERTARNIASWPYWMRREAGITEHAINTDYMREAAQALLVEADQIDQRRRDS